MWKLHFLGGQRLVKIGWNTDGVGAVDRSYSSTHKTLFELSLFGKPFPRHIWIEAGRTSPSKNDHHLWTRWQRPCQCATALRELRWILDPGIRSLGLVFACRVPNGAISRWKEKEQLWGMGCCLKDLVIWQSETASSFIQSTKWLLLDPPSGAPSALIR